MTQNSIDQRRYQGAVLWILGEYCDTTGLTELLNTLWEKLRAESETDFIETADTALKRLVERGLVEVFTFDDWTEYKNLHNHLHGAKSLALVAQLNSDSGVAAWLTIEETPEEPCFQITSLGKKELPQ